MFVLGKDHHVLSKPPKEKGGTTKSFLGHHPLVGDGLYTTSLYYYLWKRNHNLKGCQALIPETVIFDGMMPRSWYLFDSKNAEIKKKGLREVSIGSIKREFSKPIRISDPSGNGKIEHDIVAQYMYAAGYTEDGEEIITVEFLQKDDLENFLTKRPKKGTSMLQRFVPPKGPYNGLIQAIWSPFIQTCERRFNVHKLTDYRWSKFERAVTYEGPFYYSKRAFCAPKLKKDVKSICEMVVHHVSETERKSISRMVLFFKVDPDDQVWLLWSNCLRVHDKLASTPTPMNLSQHYSPPTTEVCTNWLKSSRQDKNKNKGQGAKDKEGRRELKVPVVPQDLTHCANCGRMFERDDRYALSVANIARYTELQHKSHLAKTSQGHRLSQHGPMAITLYDSGLPSGGQRQPHSGSGVFDEDDPAYQDILMDDHRMQQRRTKDIRLCQFLFQQLDNTLYEAYSHFQLTQKSFLFTLQVDPGLSVHDKCISLLQALHNIKSLDNSPRQNPDGTSLTSITDENTEQQLNATGGDEGLEPTSPSKSKIPNSLFCVLATTTLQPQNNNSTALSSSVASPVGSSSKKRNKLSHSHSTAQPSHDESTFSPTGSKKSASLRRSYSTASTELTPRSGSSGDSKGRSRRSRSRRTNSSSGSEHSDSTTSSRPRRSRKNKPDGRDGSTDSEGSSRRTSSDSLSGDSDEKNRSSGNAKHTRRRRLRKKWADSVDSHGNDYESNSDYSKDKTTPRGQASFSATDSDGGSDNGVWAESTKPTIPHHLLKSLHFQIDWDSTLSLVQLQRHFQAAKLAAEIELYPPGHPRRRRLVERQRQGLLDTNDFLTADISSDKNQQNKEEENATALQLKKAYENSTMLKTGGLFGGATSPTSAAASPTAPATSREGSPRKKGGVPSVLQHLFPTLTAKEYAYLAAEPAFLNQTVEVCASCFLTFTDISSQDLHAFTKPKHSKVRAKVDHINKHFIRRSKQEVGMLAG
eukprot:TRINITY_DN48933_c0_g1_i1.p1 TRINITY_DN48933_c0_g1~~TRINITY_DN48933_c0_g1_i1.p1  ORF type:complete len:978 (+),score=58.43 TRINITY_DN48933_c0_g1_i1:105-3038(+)